MTRRRATVPVLRTDESFPDAPRQARSLEKRRDLLDAGRTLFGQQGYENTSIADITSRAGTAAGGFYLHFRSKRQLLVVLMNELIERLSTVDLRPTDTADVRAGLRTFLTAVFRVDVSYYGVVRAWQEAALSHAELEPMQRDIEAWTHGRVLALFQLLQQLPSARRDRDLPTFARMMDRHFWALLARGHSARAPELQREISVAADVIYHYLFADAEEKKNVRTTRPGRFRTA